MNKKRVFSGTRASGRLHLGNYLGAVKGYICLSEKKEYDCIFMVMDLHAVTTPYKKEKLASDTRNVVTDYLACGLNPEKAIITVQSLVPEHSYLAFLLSSVVSVARMRHLPTYKEKVKFYPENVTMALLNYPVLMAADILVYGAELVPVGIDQEPHLEVAREIARKMNKRFGTNFFEPIRFATKGEYVPSLRGEGKMSKSVEGSYINLSDSFEEIKAKIRGVKTETVASGEKPAGVKTLFKLLRLFDEKEYEKFNEKYSKDKEFKFVILKDRLAEIIYEELGPFRKKRERLEKEQGYIDRVIRKGAEKARKMAREKLEETKKKMGLLEF